MCSLAQPATSSGSEWPTPQAIRTSASGRSRRRFASATEITRSSFPQRSSIGIPMLLLWGNEDRVISVADAKRLRDLPLAEVRIACGVGHSLPLEVAGWANEHIARFANSLTQL